MQTARRRLYLEAIGIDLWEPRAPPAPAPAGREPAAAASAADRAGDSAAEPAGAEAAAESAAGFSAESAAAGSGAATAAWAALRAEVLSCTRCPLHVTRTQGVLGVGPQRADWLVIGEAPGAEEDRRGEPFVGAAGQLLDAMLRAIGLDRKSNVYIANVLKSRPPGNRDPRPEEVAACLPYLVRQVALLEPQIMLAVGRIAAQNLLATDTSLARLRGRVHHFGERATPLVVTYHPAYLLRTPGDKRKAWEDLKFARSVYQQLRQGTATDGNRS
ncbi:MAG: uracil-DNA glycosylase [Gammaproteobacteria bacterium]|nr:uracil-DNA glycosylase [Gammaproteobacteria bacterium]